MKNKGIILIAAGIAAFFLLSKDNGIGGGSGGSLDIPLPPIFGNGGGNGSVDTGGSVDTSGSGGSNITPSPYLADLMSKKAAETLTPLSQKQTAALWSSDKGVNTVLDAAKKQNATVYTAPKLYDSRSVEYYVELGNQPGQWNPTVAPAPAPVTVAPLGSISRFGGYTSKISTPTPISSSSSKKATSQTLTPLQQRMGVVLR